MNYIDCQEMNHMVMKYGSSKKNYIFPNYFGWLKSKGIHAYNPLFPSQEGILLIEKDVAEKGVADVMDIKEPIETWTLGRLLLRCPDNGQLCRVQCLEVW